MEIITPVPGLDRLTIQYENHHLLLCPTDSSAIA